jgi:hypothetical protein
VHKENKYLSKHARSEIKDKGLDCMNTVSCHYPEHGTKLRQQKEMLWTFFAIELSSLRSREY